MQNANQYFYDNSLLYFMKIGQDFLHWVVIAIIIASLPTECRLVALVQYCFKFIVLNNLIFSCNKLQICCLKLYEHRNNKYPIVLSLCLTFICLSGFVLFNLGHVVLLFFLTSFVPNCRIKYLESM